MIIITEMSNNLDLSADCSLKTTTSSSDGGLGLAFLPAWLASQDNYFYCHVRFPSALARKNGFSLGWVGGWVGFVRE